MAPAQRSFVNEDHKLKAQYTIEILSCINCRGKSASSATRCTTARAVLRAHARSADDRSEEDRGQTKSGRRRRRRRGSWHRLVPRSGRHPRRGVQWECIACSLSGPRQEDEGGRERRSLGPGMICAAVGAPASATTGAAEASRRKTPRRSSTGRRHRGRRALSGESAAAVAMGGAADTSGPALSFRRVIRPKAGLQLVF